MEASSPAAAVAAPAAIACGGEHTLALRPDGAAFSSGACGLGWNRLQAVFPGLLSWRRAPIPEPVAAVVGGSYHSLALTKTGKLFAWGCGTFTDGRLDGAIPALGQRSRATETLDPALVDVGGACVVEAAAGAYHSVARTADGRVFTFGAAQLGQLGRPVGAQVDGAGLPVSADPGEAALTAGDLAVKVGAAFYNTFAICKSGVVLCAVGRGVQPYPGDGENQYGQCGAGMANLALLTRVNELKGHDVTAVTGGYCHTLALTRAGFVVTLGCGDDGQRGASTDATSNVVRLPNRKAVSIAAGANHSLALADDGSVWGFGSNEYGQLGGGDDEPVFSPRRVPLAQKCVAVSAGYAHSVLSLADGSAVALGRGENGQLANGTDKDRVQATPCDKL